MLRFHSQPTQLEFFKAAQTGNIDTINLLLAQGLDAAVDNNRALRWAATHGHHSVVERLLEIPAVEANATALNNAALRWAYANGHLAVVRRLIELPSVRAVALVSDNLAEELTIQIRNYDNLMRLRLGA